MIYQIEDYYDVDGTHVREYVIIEGEKPDDFPKFVAVGHIEIELPGMQPMPRRFSADIDAENIADAFANAKDAIEKHAPEAVKKFQEEIEAAQKEQMKAQMEDQRKIIIPDALPQ